MRGGTRGRAYGAGAAPAISIHPPRAGWDVYLIVPIDTILISIHPPRAGWDWIIRDPRTMQPVISIHPPRAGWDHRCPRYKRLWVDFNPPTPCGVGPPVSRRRPGAGRDFNPPTPCGVGRFAPGRGSRWYAISIHPPRVGWDRLRVAQCLRAPVFQSTHPVWGGT